MVKKVLMQTYLWVLLLLLYAPILIIVIYSFTDAKVLGNWTGFSLNLYRSLCNTGAHHSLMNALINTIAIAFIAATVSTLLGSVAAIGIYNLKARSRKAMGFINTIPILNGDIITGISLFLLFVSLGITQGFTTVVLAHITFCTPYVVLSVLPRLKQMNPNLYEAALDLGATPMQALWKVIVPEIRPGMVSGFLPGTDHFHRRFCGNGVYHWKSGIGNAFYLYLCRCPQGWSDAGASSAVGRDFCGDTGTADYY